MYKEMREGAQGELILGTIKHNKWDHMVKHLTLSRDTTNLHDNWDHTGSYTGDVESKSRDERECQMTMTEWN